MQRKCKVQNVLKMVYLIQISGVFLFYTTKRRHKSSCNNYIEIGAEWERSQWKYLYDLFSVISLYDTVNRPAEPTGYNSALVLKLTMNILATTKPRHWCIVVQMYIVDCEYTGNNQAKALGHHSANLL